MRLLTDKQCLASLAAWCAAVALWLIFSPGIVWIIERIVADAV